MHAFEMGEDDVAVERVPVVAAGVGDDGVGHGVLVVAFEVTATPWTGLLVGHDEVLSAACATGRRAIPASAPATGSGRRSRRRRSCALRATTTVDADINTAPRAGESVMPAKARTPAARG